MGLSRLDVAMPAILVDLTALLREATGVDNYLMRLVMHFDRIDQTNHYTLFREL